MLASNEAIVAGRNSQRSNLAAVLGNRNMDYKMAGSCRVAGVAALSGVQRLGPMLWLAMECRMSRESAADGREADE